MTSRNLTPQYLSLRASLQQQLNNNIFPLLLSSSSHNNNNNNNDIEMHPIEISSSSMFQHHVVGASQDLQETEFLLDKESGGDGNRHDINTSGNGTHRHHQQQSLSSSQHNSSQPHRHHRNNASHLKKRKRSHHQGRDHHSQHDDNEETPQWWNQYWLRWQRISKSIHPNLTELHQLHKTHLVHHIGKSQELHRHEKEEIHALTEEIKQILHEMQIFIKKLSVKKQNTNPDENPQEYKIYDSLQRKYLSEWTSYAEQFQKEQEVYLTQLESLKRRRQELSMIDTSDAQDENLEQELDQMMDSMYEKGFSDEQIEQIIQNRRDVIKRDQELSEIVRSIVELQELFAHVNSLVLEQGTMLDRIDFNLEQTHSSLTRANKHLIVAEKHDRAGRGIICILLLIVAVCVIGAVFFVKVLASLA